LEFSRIHAKNRNSHPVGLERIRRVFGVDAIEFNAFARLCFGHGTDPRIDIGNEAVSILMGDYFCGGCFYHRSVATGAISVFMCGEDLHDRPPVVFAFR